MNRKDTKNISDTRDRFRNEVLVNVYENLVWEPIFHLTYDKVFDQICDKKIDIESTLEKELSNGKY